MTPEDLDRIRNEVLYGEQRPNSPFFNSHSVRRY